jgi:hypothetical protein
MRIRERMRYEMFIRVVTYINDNIADFAMGSLVLAQLAILTVVVTTIQTLIGDQSYGYGEAGFEFGSKATARENLRQMLEHIAETARSMVYAYPGIDDKFRMTRNRNDAEMLAKAKAFLREAEMYKAAFIDDFLMDANFMIELQTLIDEFEQALGATGTAIDTHVEATASLGEEIRKGMVAVRTMTAPVTNKYRNNPGKLAGWLSASHIRKEPESTPTPGNA